MQPADCRAEHNANQDRVRTEQYSSPERAGRAAICRPFARTSDSNPYPPRRPSPDGRRVWRAREPASTRRVQRPREPTRYAPSDAARKTRRRAASDDRPENRVAACNWRRANAPKTVSFPRARTHGCRLRRKGIRNSRKSCGRPGTKRACASNSLCGTEKYTSRYPQPDPARIRQPPSASSTTSNRRTDPPIGTRAIRARATPRTGRIRILVLPARNQPRAAPLAHLLDEQREAEPNALANNPRAGHLELGHRQVELLELARRDPQLQCPIQRFNVRFPDGRQRHNPPPLRMRREDLPDWAWSSPRTDTPASTPAAATGPQPL